MRENLRSQHCRVLHIDILTAIIDLFHALRTKCVYYTYMSITWEVANQMCFAYVLFIPYSGHFYLSRIYPSGWIGFHRLSVPHFTEFYQMHKRVCWTASSFEHEAITFALSLHGTVSQVNCTVYLVLFATTIPLVQSSILLTQWKSRQRNKVFYFVCVIILKNLPSMHKQMEWHE